MSALHAVDDGSDPDRHLNPFPPDPDWLDEQPWELPDDAPGPGGGAGEGYGLEPVDWADLFAGREHEDALVDGMLPRGRWTAWVATAKAGKSTLALHVAASLANGRGPFDDGAVEPVEVLYLDAEMGRIDVLDRLRDDLHLSPADLGRLRYVDLVPTLNTPQGAAALLACVAAHDVALVVIDGLNGVVDGPEKEDATWRPLYALTIAALKRENVAVLTIDNLGKDKTLGPRGSSVKVDKADAVIQLERTDAGVRLVRTHTRTAAYMASIDLDVSGIDDPDEPTRYRHSTGSWIAGTADKARELDEIGVPLDTSNATARTMLRDASRKIGKSEVLAAAVRYRKTPGYGAQIGGER